MNAKRRSVKQEPILNTVARKLGHAAGTLTKVTQQLKENLSALPENVTAKAREAAKMGEPADRSRVPVRHAHARGRTAKVAAGFGKKRKLPKDKPPRRRPEA